MKLSTIAICVALLVSVQLAQADILPAAAFTLSVGSHFLRRLAQVKDRLRSHLERAIHDYYRRRTLYYGHYPVAYGGVPYVGTPFVPNCATSMHKTTVLGSAYSQRPIQDNPTEAVAHSQGNDTTERSAESVKKGLSVVNFLSIRPGHLIAGRQHVPEKVGPAVNGLGSATSSDETTPSPEEVPPGPTEDGPEAPEKATERVDTWEGYDEPRVVYNTLGSAKMAHVPLILNSIGRRAP